MRLAAWSIVCLATWLAVSGCARSDDLADLARQADAIAQARQPDLDALVARIGGLKRGVRSDRAGWENMLRTAELANDTLGLPPFTQSVPPGPSWRPSPASLLGMGPYVHDRAAQLAAQHSRRDLAFLIDDERARYDRGIAEVDARIREVERWLAAQP